MTLWGSRTQPIRTQSFWSAPMKGRSHSECVPLHVDQASSLSPILQYFLCGGIGLPFACGEAKALHTAAMVWVWATSACSPTPAVLGGNAFVASSSTSTRPSISFPPLHSRFLSAVPLHRTPTNLVYHTATCVLGTPPLCHACGRVCGLSRSAHGLSAPYPRSPRCNLRWCEWAEEIAPRPWPRSSGNACTVRLFGHLPILETHTLWY